MEQHKLIQALGFIPKENTSDVHHKEYPNHNSYAIEVDFENKIINYGNKIKGESKTTQNFSQPENWVVLECVDRLLNKNYKPEDITLEKVFPSGHGHSGRLDVFVQKEGKAFLMIECKTFGKEYDKELKSIHKNGGQLFTYFQNDTNTQYLMLYASHLNGKEIKTHWDIVKIEDHYRGAGNVADFYDRWSKVTYQNGIFEEWVAAYDFKNKLLTKKELLPLEEIDSEAIFNGFMSILRKHSVSDEPNAFNKIFNLFLAKIFDEKKRDNDELEFQWREKVDDPVTFQIRLINLYQKGMYEFLRKEVEGIKDEDFRASTAEELHEKKKKWLMFNNVFAIKEVIDSESFDDNHRVLKEVVELLHKYQIRYPRRQAHLSDFFERLLTTGLKQKAGQFFSPPPITRFIARSLPLKELINEELKGETARLPAVIDYAVGSGHFITEVMEEYQSIIDNDIDTTNLYPEVLIDVEGWQRKKYDWAAKYIYGIEKDYRLVKVAKVGCYFYGDGLAQIIHGDGLDSFKDSKSFVGRLKKVNDSELEKFSIVVSNPPYSVSTFKGDLKNKNADKDFELYDLLSDKSSEIECLFIERTKQILKDGGIAGIILPSSILSNAGNLHTKTREIILQHFDIVAIAELGGNTFMATNTNTVALFLRRKYKKIDELKESCHESIANSKDVTINGVKNTLAKYVSQVWENISMADYTTLLRQQPNEAIATHDIYKEYRKKIKAKEEADFWNILLQKEEEKLFYFVLAQPQKVVVVKAGEKEVEKDFLGYEFSNRRNNEGMFARQKGKTIDECTKMYSPDEEDAAKANYYILNAFRGVCNLDIGAELLQHVRYVDLADMLTFNRMDFDKSISLNTDIKVTIESSWEQIKLEAISLFIKRGKSAKYGNSSIQIIKSGQARGHEEFDFSEKHYVEEGFILDERKLERSDILINSTGVGTAGRVTLFDLEGTFVADSHITILRPDKEKVNPDYILACLAYIGFKNIEAMAMGQSGQVELSISTIQNIRIPLPPKDVQIKIAKDIEALEVIQKDAEKNIGLGNNKIDLILSTNPQDSKPLTLEEVCDLKAGKFVSAYDISSSYKDGLYPCFGGNGLRGYTQTFTHDGKHTLIGRQGALSGNINMAEGKFHATEHAVVVTPFDEINGDWLHHQLKLLNLNQYTTGTAQPGLSVQNIKTVMINVPPLSEQQKIVSEVEQIEQQVKVLEQQLAAIPEQKKEVLKKYLN